MGKFSRFVDRLWGTTPPVDLEPRSIVFPSAAPGYTSVMSARINMNACDRCGCLIQNETFIGLHDDWHELLDRRAGIH